MKLVVSDAHEGLKQAIARVLGATWQRCRVPLGDLMIAVPAGPDRQLCCRWMRNALAHVAKGRPDIARVNVLNSLSVYRSRN